MCGGEGTLLMLGQGVTTWHVPVQSTFGTPRTHSVAGNELTCVRRRGRWLGADYVLHLLGLFVWKTAIRQRGKWHMLRTLAFCRLRCLSHLKRSRDSEGRAKESALRGNVPALTSSTSELLDLVLHRYCQIFQVPLILLVTKNHQ